MDLWPERGDLHRPVVGNLDDTLGYWTSRAHTRYSLACVAWLQAGVLLAGLLIVPFLLGYPASQWYEWLAAMTGLALGWAGHRSEAYLGTRCDSPSTSESY